MFLPLFKGEEASRTVWARAASEELDKSREIMDYETAVPQFKAWSQQFADATLGKSLGNIRAMHNPRHLAGKVEDIVYNDDTKSIDICLKVLDPVDWAKVQEGGYTGLSIGGGYLKKWADTLHKGATRYTPKIAEISLVDAPCMPNSRFLELQKRDGSVQEIVLVGHPRTFSEIQPPRTFGELQKSLLPLAGFAAGGGYGARLGGKIGAKIARHAGAGVQGMQDATRIGQYVGGGAAALTGLEAGERLASVPNAYTSQQPRKPKLAMPGHMQKASILPAAGLLGGVIAGGKVGGMLGYRAARLARADYGGTGERVAVGTGQVVGSVAGGAAGLKYGQHLAAQRQARRQPKLAMPAHMRKAAEPDPGKAKVAQTMHEWKAGKLRSWRGTTPKGNPRRGPKVTDQKQAIAIALSQARRMGKIDDPLGAAIGAVIAERLRKAVGDEQNAHIRSVEPVINISATGPGDPKGMTLVDQIRLRRQTDEQSRRLKLTMPAYMQKSDAEMFLERLEKRAPPDDAKPAAATQSWPQAKAKAAPAGQAALSDKQHAERIAAAKARWVKEGHHDMDPHFDSRKAQAAQSPLGAGNKVAAVEQQRHNFWHGVADTQHAYDKVRKHIDPKAHLMMEVPHQAGLLYNPEGVGEKHFDASGRPSKPLYMLHPAETDDWIKKHGKGAAAVAKSAPPGEIANLHELGAITLHPSGWLASAQAA